MEPSSSERLDALGRDVAAIGQLTVETVPLAWSGHQLSITRPTNMDALLDRIVDDPEQNLPYWAELWPSGIALADAILCSPEAVRHGHVVELGCGAGTTAAAALIAGASLTVTDYAPDALTLCRYNCLVNASREPAGAIQMNWRRPGPPLLRRWQATIPVLIAADALYERRDIAPLVDLVDHMLTPDGLFWLAGPGRGVAAEFLDQMRRAGWHVTSAAHEGPWPDPADHGTIVGLHQIRRG